MYMQNKLIHSLNDKIEVMTHTYMYRWVYVYIHTRIISKVSLPVLGKIKNTKRIKK